MSEAEFHTSPVYGGQPGDVVWSAASTRIGALVADGSVVSRTTYARLFAAIGTTYGVGDGSTTFGVPNIKGKTIVGIDSGDAAFNTLGATGGSKTHTLITSQMPSHTHTVSITTSSDSHTHSFSATTSSDAHSHGIGTTINRFVVTNRTSAFANREAPASTSGSAYVPAYAGDGSQTVSSSSTTNSDTHSHTVSGTTGSGSHTHTVSGSTGSEGSGNSFNILQPYIVLTPFILT